MQVHGKCKESLDTSASELFRRLALTHTKVRRPFFPTGAGALAHSLTELRAAFPTTDYSPLPTPTRAQPPGFRLENDTLFLRHQFQITKIN